MKTRQRRSIAQSVRNWHQWLFQPEHCKGGSWKSISTAVIAPQREGGKVLVKEAAPRRARSILLNHWDKEYPVNPVDIAESLGISVKFADLKAGVSGAIIAKNRDNIEILVQASDSYERQMFTIAHELGHFAERLAHKDDEYSFVERRGKKYDIHELYANEFAGALLMPENKFRSIYEETGSAARTADFFEVSEVAVKKRLERLGL